VLVLVLVLVLRARIRSENEEEGVVVVASIPCFNVVISKTPLVQIREHSGR
jgi:hypothetical protein